MPKKRLKSTKIRIGDISISYLIKSASTSKDNKTVLFIHGFPFNKNMWRNQLMQLEDQITGIAIDVRGHGLSTSGHGYFSMDVFAKDLAVFLEKLGLDQVYLCGISMGGYIALRAYELFPEKIAGLILSDTHAQADSNASKEKRFDTIDAVLKYGKRPFSIGFINNVFSAYSMQHNPEAIELIKSSIRRNSIASICATSLALASRMDMTPLLKKIKVPSLLIRGTEDKLVTADQFKELTKIQKSKIVEVAHSGHLPNLENPAAFNTALNEFLAAN